MAAFQTSEDTYYDSLPSSKLLFWIMVPTTVPHATGYLTEGSQLVGVLLVMQTPKQNPLVLSTLG